MQMVRAFLKQKYLYLMVLPGFILVFIFKYMPMYGVIIAFKDYNVFAGILESKWVGLRWFRLFFDNPMALRVFKNTLLLGLYNLIFAFPLPIILALLLNELKIEWIKRTIQSITYLPYFISVIIIVGMLKELASLNGLFNQVLMLFNIDAINFFGRPEFFRTLFIGSGIWQNLGWGTILYLAALTNIDPALYEAAHMDGANRFRKMLHITLPGMAGTIVILLILAIGNMLEADFQRVLLMYNPVIYSTADIVGTYVYREGLESARFSYATAVGLMVSVISFVLLLAVNQISRRYSENSLW